MKFGFVTCVQLGLECMEEIYAAGGRLDLAITLPDEVAVHKAGRVYLDEFCESRSIPLLKARHIDDNCVTEAIRAGKLDWLFIIGWSQIAGRKVLDAPTRGVLGIHPTLLPQGRGRAPVPWAILKDLNRTGVTLFKLEEGVDTGPVLAQEVLPLHQREDATSLYERVKVAHRKVLRHVWRDLENDAVRLVPQDESRATLWPGRGPADGEIRPNMSVDEVDRLVRATTHPYPGAFIDHPQHGRVRIWRGFPGVCEEAESKHLRISFIDGIYSAVEYDLEHGCMTE